MCEAAGTTWQGTQTLYLQGTNPVPSFSSRSRADRLERTHAGVSGTNAPATLISFFKRGQEKMKPVVRRRKELVVRSFQCTYELIRNTFVYCSVEIRTTSAADYKFPGRRDATITAL
jgi:hypothetical protein